MNEIRAFANVPLPTRATKPRDHGLTMLIDEGLPVGLQRDVLEINGPFVDMAKIAVGISGLLPQDLLRKKISSYIAMDVMPFPGGMFLEYAVAHGKVDEYLQGCADAGFPAIEVSDNARPFERTQKQDLIRRGVDSGFIVLGEVGSKHQLTSALELAHGVEDCRAAGAWKVLVEAAELLDGGKVRMDVLDAVLNVANPAEIIWELPGPWLSGVHHHEVHAIAVELIDSFGRDVNIGNVALPTLTDLEALRLGISDNLPIAGAHA